MNVHQDDYSALEAERQRRAVAGALGCLVLVGLALALVALTTCKAFMPEINASACLADCMPSMQHCGAAKRCAAACEVDGSCQACAAEQVECVDAAFVCASTCAAKVEEQLR